MTDFYAGLLVEITADRLRLHQRRGDRQGVSETARELLALAARTHADRHLQVAMEALGRA